MGIGLGPDSYAIIEQGRIGQVLSSKPSDRRAIIEEAAGITKYKTKKRLAEAKLETSKVNLGRVNDIYVEVEKQLGSLKRQASKARRYAELREQMRGLLRRVLASKARELDSEATRVERLLSEIGTQETEQAQSVGALEAEQQRLDKRTYEVDTEMRQNQNLIGQAALEVDRAENRILFNKRRGEELRGREQQLAGERDQSTTQLAQVEARVASQGDVVERLRIDAANRDAVLGNLAERTAELSGSGRSAEAQIVGLRSHMAELDALLKRLQGTQAEAEQSLAHHSGALERLEKNEHDVLEESLYHRERSRVSEIRWHSVTERARRLEQSVKDAQAQIASLSKEQQEATARCQLLRDELAGARARRGTLEQILNDRSYTADAVQKLFASSGENNSRNFKAVGVLADYAEVQPQYEGALEQFLQDELEYVVVETFDHARAGISMLREEVGGRATFFVDSLRSLNLAAQPEPLVPFSNAPGVVSRLDNLVEFRDPLGPAAKQFLPRLQSAFLIENAEAAERLARENPAYNFLTPDGTCYQGRSVSGGRPTEAGPLVMKRELRALEAEAIRLEREMADGQAALDQIAASRQELEETLKQTTIDHVESEKAVAAATVERDQSRAELARLGLELATCQKEIARLRQESESSRQKAAGALEEQSGSGTRARSGGTANRRGRGQVGGSAAPRADAARGSGRPACGTCRAAGALLKRRGSGCASGGGAAGTRHAFREPRGATFRRDSRTTRTDSPERGAGAAGGVPARRTAAPRVEETGP